MNLGEGETLNYESLRTVLRADARRLAVKRAKRFARIVGIDGRVLDVVEC